MSDTFSQPIVEYGYEQNYRFKPTDDEWGDTAGRVVDALLKPDENHPRYAQLRRRAYDAIYNRRFLPGGRVIANAGTSYDKATMINCYVSGPRKDEHDIDSIDSIYRELERCAKILASEGGYGFNADWMRPRGALIQGSGARTPGAVEMLNLWDQTSQTLTKGPEIKNEREDAKEKIRKGAMMVTMSLWHPDVMEFIKAKQESGRLSKFNMSVLVSDRFMEAVEAGEEWYFVYPDFEKAESRYEAEWDGNIRKWTEKGPPTKTYDSLPAADVWDMIMDSTYERNEPGVLFVDTINDRNPDMSEQDRTKRLDHFLNDLAEATSKDEEIADHQLRSRGIDPDVCGKDLVTMKRRILAQAKAQEEHQIREGVKSGVEARVQELMEKFGSAIEALRHGLEEDRLSHQYRNLESEPTEDEAKQMLREEIELKLSDED